MQLGGFDHIDKKTEHEFADLTRQQKRERQKVWRKESGYNDRWSVEIAFSTFKRIFGECMNARKWENVKMEIYGKVCLYNHMIDMEGVQIHRVHGRGCYFGVPAQVHPAA